MINRPLIRSFQDAMELVTQERARPRPYVAPAPLIDPDADLRREVVATLQAQGFSANMIAMATAGGNLLREAEKMGLL